MTTLDQNPTDLYDQVHPLDYSPARYDLSAEELLQLEQEMVNFVEQRTGHDGLTALWINPNHKYANLVRMHEASYFPEVAELSGEDEDQTLFYAMVDTREGSKRVVHAATVCTFKDYEQGTIPSETGFFTVDGLIEEGNFNSQEFVDYYTAKGIDIKDCISVETNFRVGARAEKLNGVSPADLSYLMFFRKLLSNGASLNHSGVLATINKASKISFDRVGLQYEPLMGREDFVTPESFLGVDSSPVLIPYTEHADNLFAALAGFGIEVPELSV